ncbi:phage major capsid protein [Ligilactobacillus equi]
MNINELKLAFDEAGAKVQALEDKRANLIMDLKNDVDSHSADELQEIKKQLDKAVIVRDMAEETYTDARANQVAAMKVEDKKPLTDKEEKIENKFISDFKDMVKGTKVFNQVNSTMDGSGSDAGLTIPQDIQTAIHALVRQYDSLQEYVNVETVGTATGSRVFEKWADVTALAAIDAEDGKIGDNDDPKLTVIKYTIKRYAGITTATNSLLADTAENILTWLSGWIAKKVVVTRNQAILSVVDKFSKKPTLTKWDDIIDLENSVDPAIKATSVFMTNTSGMAALRKVKNAMGDYLMKRDVTAPNTYVIDGYRVIEIADRWLADNSGTHPLYFGDLKQAVTLFDRQAMSIMTTNIGGGAFETDTTKIRVIDRFDVEATDSESFVPGSFKTIADQEANFTAAATK